MDLLLIALIAFATSVFAGMLGLGGAVLLIPAYLYIPPLLGLQAIDVKSISGITSVQVFASSLLGLAMHHRQKAVSSRLVLTMGIPITIASLTGALVSGIIPPHVIIAIFGTMALFGAVLMLVKRKEELQGSPEDLNFSTIGAISIAGGVGFFGGMVGAPGAFLLSPLMMTILEIPTRITIGSTLGIVVLSALSASIGKAATGQVPVAITAAAVIGSLPGVYLGSKFSHRLETGTLRWILAGFIGAVGVQMIYRVFF